MSSNDQATDPVAGDIAGASGTPDAIEATSTTATTYPISDPAWNPEHRVGRGVAWVRPTDLVARSGSRVAARAWRARESTSRPTWPAGPATPWPPAPAGWRNVPAGFHRWPLSAAATLTIRCPGMRSA